VGKSFGVDFSNNQIVAFLRFSLCTLRETAVEFDVLFSTDYKNHLLEIAGRIMETITNSCDSMDQLLFVEIY
jgi:hypothetical protein